MTEATEEMKKQLWPTQTTAAEGGVSESGRWILKQWEHIYLSIDAEYEYKAWRW